MAEESNVPEIPKSAEDIAFEEMDSALNTIKEQREQLAKQLIEAAKTTKINPTEDTARVTEVKLALFKTADDLLKSQESLHVTKAKLQLNRKSEASNENVKALAIEVLRNTQMNMRGTAPVQVADTVTKVLNATFDQNIANNPDLGGDIKEEELTMDDK